MSNTFNRWEKSHFFANYVDVDKYFIYIFNKVSPSPPLHKMQYQQFMTLLTFSVASHNVDPSEFAG